MSIQLCQWAFKTFHYEIELFASYFYKLICQIVYLLILYIFCIFFYRNLQYHTLIAGFSSSANTLLNRLTPDLQVKQIIGNQSTENPPIEGQSTEDQSTDEASTGDPSTEDRSTEDESTEYESAEERLTEYESTEEELTREEPTEEKPTEKKPTEKKPTEKKPTEKKPTEKKPTEEKPTEEEPTEEEPTEEEPTEEESTEEESLEEELTRYILAKNKLTESMALINTWIDETDSKRLHTIIPSYPTKSDQKKFSRLVLIELFVSFRRTRLQRFLRTGLLKGDKKSIQRVNALSTLILLAYDTKPSERPGKGSLELLLSAGLLMTTSEYVSRHLLLKMAPFDDTENELMLKLGYDKRKLLLPTKKILLKQEERRKFLKDNIFMLHPFEKDDIVKKPASKTTKRVWREIRSMSYDQLNDKMNTIYLSLQAKEEKISILRGDLFDEGERVDAIRSEIEGETQDNQHNMLTHFIKAKQRQQKLLRRVKKILKEQVYLKWYNAIVEANLKGVPFKGVSTSISETRISYEVLLASLHKFQNILYEHEKNNVYRIFERLDRRIPNKNLALDSRETN